ncbi:helix-turn-helix domain-containing protein [Actinomadura rubrisoli]|uniref:XRE family transcriptional regulator n=1 Tax=Actinomadura rubrisoli TaxID=2530368 RepID=A0A4R4ZT58_9ACTN|nr:helix-turn-helix transcriptional regulator [Actinomadura rubrisoli]TDD62278.1 XRE family transcriptional regulator [Actinomadura rubrisoli]
MSADKRAIGRRLRKAREEPPYWTRGDLARLLRNAATPKELPFIAHVPSLEGMIKQWENGRYVPGRRYRLLYARVTGRSEDELFAPEPAAPSLWRSPELNGALSPDDEDRLNLAIRKPYRLDLTVVDSLAAILAAQRRLDDTAGPAAILPATLAQTDAVTGLLGDARGRARDALLPVAGEYVQFAGWLHAELRNDQTSMHLLTDAEALADDAADGTLAAQAANFKGYLARQADNPRGIVRHFLTAYHTPGAAPAQRLGDAVQAAQGLALLGEGAAARRLLNEAEALEEPAARSLPPGTAYWLTPDFQHINVGLALLSLGEHMAAAEHLSAGLEALPPDQRHAPWTGEYYEALERARGQE